MSKAKTSTKRAMRCMIWMAVLSSGVAFGAGCDTEVRTLVLSGLNELVVALIDAIFVSLAPTETVSLETMTSELAVAFATPWQG